MLGALSRGMKIHERKHSAAQRAYWSKIRAIMRRHGLTMKEARTMYRLVMARVAREVAAARRFLVDGPRRLPCPRYKKGCHSSSHLLPHHHLQREMPW